MKLAIIGTGYVGLVSGTCLAEFGFDVTCVDRDAGKIAGLQNGVMPIYELGLDDLVEKNTAAGRLHFTTDLGPAVRDADAVFIAVGTPEGPDHRPKLDYARAAAREIAPHLTGYTVIVNKSTVPVGFGREVEKIVRETNPSADFDVCSNPEFLREGSAIGDFLRPDRVVIGAETPRAIEVMRAIYRPLYINETPLLVTTIESAELTKYAANAFLATKITFINEIANLCEAVGANVQDVARGIGMDNRIGKKFLHAGPGYGGSCFPKDTNALAELGKDYGAKQRIVETVIAVNDARKDEMATRIVTALANTGGSAQGKKVAILGLTFKPHTDDMRDAVSLAIIPALQQAGATIAAHDPAGMEAAAKLLQNVDFVADPYTAAQDADALVVLTEWHDFRALNLARLHGLMRGKLLVDLRNIYKPEDARAAGFTYHSVGRA